MIKRAQRDRDFGEYVAERRAHLYRTAYLLCGTGTGPRTSCSRR